jgi:hypothetical protein
MNIKELLKVLKYDELFDFQYIRQHEHQKIISVKNYDYFFRKFIEMLTDLIRRNCCYFLKANDLFLIKSIENYEDFETVEIFKILNEKQEFYVNLQTHLLFADFLNGDVIFK